MILIVDILSDLNDWTSIKIKKIFFSSFFLLGPKNLLLCVFKTNSSALSTSILSDFKQITKKTSIQNLVKSITNIYIFHITQCSDQPPDYYKKPKRTRPHYQWN